MIRRIRELAREKDAIILAHYYQTCDIQEAADIVGDSFELAKRAREAKQSTIVLCGVRFMAEGAKILNPKKRVLIPSPDAGCPLADMVTAGDVLALKAKHPAAAVVCYINSSISVKAVADVCCTSSSAVRIVKALKNRDIIFVPDQNLGAYVQSQLPEKNIILFDGFCPIHHQLSVEDIEAARAEMPGAPLLAHPECRPEVQRLADFIGSTSAILEFVADNECSGYIIATELEIGERLKSKYPDKRFMTASPHMLCKQMKKTTLEDVLNALIRDEHEVELDEAERLAAESSLVRMVNLQ